MEKLTFSSLLIFAALAYLAAGSAWHRPILAEQRASSERMAWGKAASSHLPSSWRRALPQQQCSESVCGRLSWVDAALSNGAMIQGGDVSVCTEKSSSSGLCYFTNHRNLRKCCGSAPQNVASSTLKVGSKDIFAEILYVSGIGRFAEFCVYFDVKDIDLCPRDECRRAPACTELPQFCTNNSISCGLSACVCKEGYKAPFCCECDDNYVEHDGVCQFQCKTNCRNDQCTECAHPYTDPPLCCNCTDPYIKVGGECRCPDGTIEIDGTCQTICQGNTVPCDSPPCCAEGFKAPLCCECIFDETEEGFSYFKQDGKCKKICTEHADKSKCNVNGGCSECLDFFEPQDCCECIETKQLVDGVCRDCPAGEVLVDGKCKEFCSGNIVPNSCDGTRCQCLTGYTGNDCCKCDQSQGKRILVNGKCIPVCENTVGECSETSCPCKLNFAGPDCCKCTDGSEPDDGVCAVACLDTQNVFIILDRSSGNSETELSNAVFMTQMLAGGMLRSTKNVKVTVLGYATSENSLTLREFMPVTTSGPTVTEQSCLSKLQAYAEEIYSHERPKNTLADKTMELLKPYIQTGVPNTVITFAGTVSDFQNHNPVDRIVRAINEMKGRNNVRFFSAGFEGENGELERYQNQVLALANNKRSQSVLSEDPVTLMEDLTDSLVSHGVFCKDQAKIIKTLVGQSEVYKRYNRCQDQNAEIILFNSKYTPCIDKTPFRDSCRRASTVKSFLLAMMNQLLKLE